jgi:hypothetical protein
VAQCDFRGTDDAGTTAVVDIVGTPDAVEVSQCLFVGRATGGLIRNAAGNVATNALIANNTMTGYSSTPCISLLSAVTGTIRSNHLVATTVALTLDGGACALIENYGYDIDNADEVGVLVPAQGTALAAGRSLADELLGASYNYNRTNYLAVTADFSSATWNTVATHEILTVTGAVRLRILPECTVGLASGGAGQIQLGTEAGTASFVAVTVATGIDAGDVWLSASAEASIAASSLVDQIVSAVDVGYEIQIAALTAGTIVFHCWWEPLNATGAVVAGDGSAL